MRKVQQLLAITAALGVAMLAGPAWAAAASIAGRWVTADKDAVVAIALCGAAMCGRIEKFLIAPPQGNDQRDVNNPDPAKRSRKLLGLTILSGLTADGDVWRGKVYDPNDGKTYTAKVRRQPDGTLEMKGCVGPFCQSQIWRKAS
jgi:uncharacterized protein (DUF2147 family)